MAHGFTFREIASDGTANNANSSYNTNDGTEYNRCPLDNNHVIRGETMQCHVKRCAATFKDMSFMRHCPFDSTHIVSVSEMVSHVCDCPKRGLFDTYKYAIGDTEVSAEIPPPPTISYAEEDGWDDHEHPTYNKEKELEEKKILRKKIGAQPAERKKFRNEQRSKYNQN